MQKPDRFVNLCLPNLSTRTQESLRVYGEAVTLTVATPLWALIGQNKAVQLADLNRHKYNAFLDKVHI